MIIAGLIVIDALYHLGSARDADGFGNPASWYQLLVTAACFVGAFAASIYAKGKNLSPLRARPPKAKSQIASRIEVGRWVIFFPISVIAPFLVLAPIYILIYEINPSTRFLTQALMKLEGQMIYTVLFLATVVFIVPRGKLIAATVFAAISLTIDTFALFFAIFRPLLISWFSRGMHHGIAIVEARWFIVLNSVAIIYGIFVGMQIAIEANSITSKSTNIVSSKPEQALQKS